ncbi:MAG: MFS transporter [Dehalococcoidia bacterium]
MASFPHDKHAGSPAGGVVARNYSGVWILVATILGSSMGFIDATAVNVILPIMQEDLGATLTELQWFIEAYALFLAALLLVGGTFGDRLGRKRVFMWGIGIFAGASIWAGLAPNAEQLIAARAVQGIGGALFIPGSLALIGACFTDSERGSAVGTWSSASALTMALGPLLGGWLATEFSWRWVFFINVPLAAVVILICLTRVPESREQVSGKIDWLGAALATVGLGALVYGLIESANLGFGHPEVVGTLGLGVAALIGFVVTELKVESPMIPLGVFKVRSFTGANIMTLLLYGGLGGAFFFVPLNLIQVQGYSATQAGASFLPFVLLIAVLSRYTGGLVPKIGAKIPLTVGPAIAGAGFLAFALQGVNEGSYWTTFFPAMVLFGVGMAITIAPLVTVVMGTVPQSQSGLASGVNNAVTRTGSLLAIAVFGVVALALFNGSLDDGLAAVDAPPAVVASLEDERVELAGADLPPGLPPAQEAELRNAIDEAFVDAFRGIMYISAGLAFAGAIVALFVIERRPKPRGAVG